MAEQRTRDVTATPRPVTDPDLLPTEAELVAQITADVRAVALTTNALRAVEREQLRLTSSLSAAESTLAQHRKGLARVLAGETYW